MPKISIMTMVFDGYLDERKLTDAGMLDAIEKMGYDGVEIPSGRLEKHIRQYQTHLASSRLGVTCIDGICNFISRDAKQREAAVRSLHAAIEAAVGFKCPIVLAAGSTLSGDITPDEGRRMIVEGLRACMSTAREVGVTLAIENFGVAPTLQCAAADCLAVLDAVPGLAFNFDSGNFYFRREDPLKNLALFNKRICQVHLKDWAKSGHPDFGDVAGAPLGTGFIPNQAIVKQLLKDGYPGNFSVEMGAHGDKLEAARKDLDTVKSWLAAH